MAVSLVNELADKLGVMPLDITREAQAILGSKLYQILLDTHKQDNMHFSINGMSVDIREQYRAALRGIESFSNDLIALGNNHG